MRPLTPSLLVLLLAGPALAQPDHVETVPLDDGVELRLRLVGLDPDDVVGDRNGNAISATGCGDVQRLTPLVVADSAIIGSRLDAAAVFIDRPGGRRDTVQLDTGCLYWFDLEEARAGDGPYPLVHVRPVPAPLAGGWELTQSVGDGDGYVGDWVVGQAWEAHRSGTPVPFQDADDRPSIERLRTELVLLAEGVRLQREALRACTDVPAGCPDAVVAHDRWLGALGRWVQFASAVGY